MRTSLPDLKNLLETDPAAQVRFLADALTVLADQGVDIHDKNVQSALGIDTNLTLGQMVGKMVTGPTIVRMPK